MQSTPSFISRLSPLSPLALIVMAMIAFAAMNIAVRWVSQTGMHSTQLVFLRNVASFMLIAMWIAQRRQWGALKTHRISGHVWRSTIGFTAMETWFYSLTILPLTLATALSFTTPIFATLFAIWLLKERPGWRRWAAIGASFVGVLVILRPGGDAALLGQAWIVLLSSSLMAFSGILVKSLTKSEAPETIVLYMTLIMSPLSLPLALMHWQDVTLEQLAGVGLVALFSTAAHLMMTRAYVRAEMVALLPFDFLRLIFTALFAYMVFGETLDGPTLAGGAIIMASAVYIAHREARKKREQE